MKILFKLNLVFVFCVFSLSSFAATNVATVAATIERISNWTNNEQLWIRINGDNTINPSVCDITGWYILPDDTSDISRSMLLAAKMSGQEVNLVIHGSECHGVSPNSRPRVINVNLPNQ